VRLAHFIICVPSKPAVRTCSVKIIFFDTDGIPLLVAFLYDSEGAAFDRQVSKSLIGGVSWAVAPPVEDYYKKILY